MDMETVRIVCVQSTYLEKWMTHRGVSLDCDRECEIN